MKALNYKPYQPSFVARVLGRLSPALGVTRIRREMAFHEFAYDAARPSTKRNYAPQNINPNSFDVQRDRLQLMRESFDLEKNFSPAKSLNRKYAMFTAPTSYHAQTGDPGLNKAVEEYLDSWFAACDITQQFEFFSMMEFGVMGANTGGDYGWAYMRPGVPDDATEEEMVDAALELPLYIQAVEPDRIGGVYQNVVSEKYIAGVVIGEYAQPVAYRVFRRSPIVSQYTDPVDVPADQFVHLKDPLRIDQIRPPGKLDTAVSLLRDMYETLDFMRGKQKLASALTVFTNSIGATQGPGAMDAYSTNLFANGQAGLQQDIKYGQMNHMLQGMDIKFPDTQVPGSESQFLLIFTMKLVAMSYNLPYSFALDAAELGGVSTRLESEMAKAEFERGQRINGHAATKIKNAAVLDACAKGYLPIKYYDRMCKGRWGFRQHPQPDLGKEASANVSLYQNGLLNPKKYWSDNQQDASDAAKDMVDWTIIKKQAIANSADPTLTVEEVFGKGPIAPGSGDKKGDNADDGTQSGGGSAGSDPTTGKAGSSSEKNGGSESKNPKTFAANVSSEPRDGDGKWTGGGNLTGKQAGEKHGINKRSKLTIDKVSDALESAGFRLGESASAPNENGKWITTYKVTGSDGKSVDRSPREIQEFLTGSRNALSVPAFIIE